ncbi:hypothetical protein CLV59_10720 [Chitinophaga dinghuensis]|uniref:Uncharacterized protein n=1 Tax=Chitinophaga dinghuensis TaxID=1539050 RepID=A0A327VPJ7_9BACT|nr:hypothetical protein [Chitinophaga dinghuensis]RAJ77255.1 hypothetical protein CLV59_10720 [Chitinophaga dinghuensis]
MNTMISFPEDLTDFLIWVRETTEAYWSKVSSEELIHGAKWLPLSDSQIDELEATYAIKFDVEHRAFLKILHTIDKHYEIEEAPEDEADYQITAEQKRIAEFWNPPNRPSYFYNWITDKEWIVSRLAWVEDMLMGSISGPNTSWLRSWGPPKETMEEKIVVFKEWFQKTPALLPIYAHSFLMADGGHGLKPVISVYGFDSIIVAWSLRHFLLRKFATELGLTAKYYNEEFQEEYEDMVRGIPELDALQMISLAEADIPYWKEVLRYYHHQYNYNWWEGFWVPYGNPKK